MESIFTLCYLKNGPLTMENYVDPLEKILRAEIPATVTTKDVEQYLKEQQESTEQEKTETKVTASDSSKEDTTQENEEDDDEEEEEDEQDAIGTTPLHALCASVSPDISGEELETVNAMIDTLFQWGAGWMILDENNETPGCIALRRQLPSSIYKRFVQAGTRAEVFLRKLSLLEKSNEPQREQDPAVDQGTYLATDLEYTDHALVTKEQNDGVMMDWETPIMKRSAELITKDTDGEGPVVLNVGFGMGIIDGIIQSLNPKKHYICEAHPDVLNKMKADGWYDKPNVVVLEGRWQDTLAELLEQEGGPVEFDGMYYDTFSEHYSDLAEFFNFVTSMLKSDGVFSFFNGLGADRQIVYDVYCEVLEVDLMDYGLEVKFEDWRIADNVVGDDKEAIWKGIRKQYWAIEVYKLPIIKFMS